MVSIIKENKLVNDNLLNKLNTKKIPNHIAIIMDGNGRWAKKNKKLRTFGHTAGATSLKKIIEFSLQINLNHLSVYAFSSENWKRPKKEVEFLLNLLNTQLISELNRSKKQGIRIKIIGSRKNLNHKILTAIDNIETHTKKCTKLNLNIFINYGSREEITNAVKKIIEKNENTPITEEMISKNLYTSTICDPDLLIRTSGEKRISNFLLWQLSYTELFFSEILWPDFTPTDLLKIIIDFQNRKRRFGGI